MMVYCVEACLDELSDSRSPTLGKAVAEMEEEERQKMVNGMVENMHWTQALALKLVSFL